MEFIATFKQFLLSAGRNQGSSTKATSPATVKNYLADVHHFISWFETTYQKSFNPEDITIQMVNEFKKAKSTSLSASSVDRHLSTLRKFFTFLKLDGKILSSPFDVPTSSAQLPADPYHLHDFKNYLYVYNASNLTIKNYIIDVKQFLNWAGEVLRTKDAWHVADKNILARIDNTLVEEYKQRLLQEKVFSPASINRKLSSLRKYLGWAEEQGHLSDQWSMANDQGLQRVPESLHVAAAIQSHKPYSNIPPVRLFQKLSKASTFAFDLLMVAPIAHLFRKIEHGKWIAQGKPVFVKTPLPLGKQIKRFIPHVKNISKEFYSPLSVSTKDFPWYKKLFHHARYTRPNWYRQYHQLAIAHYFNWAVLIIFGAAIGFGMYNTFVQKPGRSLAALPNQPIRVLSFQGRLTDANDNPITSPTWLRFEIYNTQSSSSSARLWEEVDKVTPDGDGIFSLLLGSSGASDGSAAALCNSGNPPASPATGACGIPSSLFANNTALWLGATVENTAELTPREQLATVAFASNAETLQGLPPITQSGAGTQNVVLALNSSGNLSIGASTTFQSTSGAFTLSGNTLALNTNAGTNGGITLAPDGTGFIDLQRPLQNSTNNGDVASAPNALTVEDLFAILATSSGQSALTINQNGTGPIISASASGNAKFTVDNSGNTTANAFYTGLGSTYYINNAISNLNSLTLANNLIVSGNVASSLIPSITDTYDLGSNPLASGKEWNNLYVNHIYENGQLISANLWQENLGALSPIHTQDDLLLGDTATTGANLKFGFLNVASGTPTATISSNFSIKVPTGANPASSINLLNGGSLGFYTATAGQYDSGLSANPALYVANNGNVGIGTTTATSTLTVAAPSSLSTAAVNLLVSGADSGSNNQYVSFNNARFNVGWNGTSGFGFLQASPGKDLELQTNCSSISCGNANVFISRNSFVGINTTQVGNGQLVINQANSFGLGDILSASASATTKFIITNSGTLGIGSNITDNSLLANTGLDIEKDSLGNATAIIHNISAGNVADLLTASNSASTQLILTNSGILEARKFSDLDNTSYFLDPAASVGNTALTVAGNVGIGTTDTTQALLTVSGTASISGNLTFSGAAQTIANTNANSLNIGDGNTGDLNLRSGFSTVYSLVIPRSVPSSTGIVQIGKNFSNLSNPSLEIGGGSTATSGTTKRAVLGGTFNPSSTSTMTSIGLSVEPTINYSAGTPGAGSYEALHIAATETALPTGTNYLIRALAGSSGTTDKFDVLNTGAIKSANYTTAGGILYADSTGLFTQTTAGSSNQCLQSTGGSAPTWGACGSGGSNFWVLNTSSIGGDIYPVNATLDFLVGGTSTASAHFGILGVNTNTTVASVSAQNGANNALYLDSVGEALQTVQAKDLTLGGSTTGAIDLKPNNGNGLVKIDTNTLTTTNSSFNLINTTATTINFAGAANTLTIGATGGTTTFQGATLDDNQATAGIFATPTTLNIGGSSQTTNLLGNIKLGNSNTNTVNIEGLVSADVIPTGNGSINLGSPTHYYNVVYANSFSSPAGNGVEGFWTITNNTNLYPTNTADDLLIGGNGTGSATFQVFAQSVGSIVGGTATTAGNLTFTGATPIISTTSMQPITIGSSSTGPIQLSPKGTTGLYVGGSGNVGINTTNPVNLLTIVSNSSGTNPALSSINDGGVQSNYYTGRSGNAAISGKTVLENTSANALLLNPSGGNVGIGTTSPVALLTVAGTASVSGVLTIGNGTTNQIRSAYGPLQLNYKSGLNTWDQALTVQDTTGNIGIGTTSPTQLLQISGPSVGFGLSDTTGGYNTILKEKATGGIGGLQIQNGSGTVILATDNTNLRVGIGTASPLDKLDVAGALALGSYAGVNTAPSNGLIVSGNVGIGTTAASDFNLELAGNVGPQATDTYNLGSASLEWNNLYVRQIISPSTGGVAGYWQLNNGVVSPANITNDLAIGGTATSSAKFQVFANTGNVYAAGNVGIGTTGPGAPLTVVRGDNSANAIASFYPLNLTESVNIGFNQIFEGGSNGNNSLWLDAQTGGSVDLASQINTNVGIGTTGPGEKLEVYGSESTDAASTFEEKIFDTTSAATGVGGGLALGGYYSGTSSQAIYAIINGIKENSTAGDFASALTFQTRLNNGSLTERLRINSAGNVGIGTTSPNGLLDVEGKPTGKALAIFNETGDQDILTASSSGTTEFQVTTAGNVIGRKFTDLDNTIYYLDPAALTVSASVAGSMTFTPASEHDINFLNNSNLNFKSSPGGDAGLTSKLFISGTTGNIGIGTTNPGTIGSQLGELYLDLINPNTGATNPQAVLGIGGTRTADGIVGDINFYNPAIGASGTDDRIGVLRYSRSGANNSGKFDLYTRNAGSYVDAMTILPAGNVGIGTTNPGDNLDLYSSGSSDNVLEGFTNGSHSWSIGYNGSSSIFRITDNTAGAARMVIDTSGNVGIGTTTTTGAKLSINGAVGIGTTSPGEQLEVVANSGGGQLRLRNSSGGGGWDLGPDSSSNNIVIYSQGGTGGQFMGNNNTFWSVRSDERLKTDIQPLSGLTGLEAIRELNPVSFEWKDVRAQGQTNLGFIAQQVQQVFPELVDNMGTPTTYYNADGTTTTVQDTLTMQYDGLIAPAIQAIKELDTSNSATLAQVQGLQNLELTETGDIALVDATPSADFTVPHYFSLSDALGNPVTRMGAFVELVVGNLRAGSVQAQQVLTNSLAVATDNISIAGTSLHDYVAGIVQQMINNQSPATNSPVASIDQIHTGIISPLGNDDSIALKIGNSGIQITNGASGSAVASFDNQGNATLSGTLNTQNLAVNGDATVSGTLYANNIQANSIQGLQEVVSTLSAQNITNINNIYFATPSGTQIADNNNIGSNGNSSSPSGVLNPSFQSPASSFASIASYSAYFAYVPNLNATTGIFQQGLTSLGPTSLTDTSIDGTLAIGSSLILADNSINVLGTDFQIQPLRQGGVQFEGGLIAINTNGDLTVGGNAVIKGNLAVHTISPIPGQNLNINLADTTVASNAAQPNLSVNNASGSSVFNLNQLGDLVASGEATVSKLNIQLAQPVLAVSDTEVVATGSAGQATIKQYQKEVTIDDPHVTANSLIYITPVGDTAGQTPYLERQVAGKSFSVGVPTFTTQAVQFNWLIVN